MADNYKGEFWSYRNTKGEIIATTDNVDKATAAELNGFRLEYHPE